ncbi:MULTISPECIES: hypothetical protein [unclassified Sphingomonas]|uniref:FAD-dependent oxidoreductase n=1 Tax=unclassified Sphingomonas TaxID=196159 RepID=UPI00092B27C1|nr:MULTISPECIES: hypothetical protein [unclassified Sphingomonas]OJU23067.1 MAG: hypothetical protein BGN95_07310 [Sphingomonas sp. 66-10]
MRNQPILIAGGGLASLCLAHGLKRAGLPFAVYQPADAPHVHDTGYRLRIDAAGQEALARCLPIDLLYLLYQTASIADSDPWSVDPNLKSLSARAPEKPDGMAKGLSDLCVYPETLRRILLCGITPHVRPGYGLRAYEETPEGIVALFDNNERATGRLLVGAEGALSAIGDPAAPAHTDTRYICGKAPATAENCQAFGRLLCAGTTIVIDDGVAALIDIMTFRRSFGSMASEISGDCLLPPVADHIYWEVYGPRLREELNGSTGAMARAIASLTRYWAPPLQAIFARSDPRDWRIRTAATPPSATIDTSGRMTQLGAPIDAPQPSSGLGLRLALQDAADLAHRLAAAGDDNDATILAGYRAAARERWRKATQVLESGDRLIAA